MKDICYWSIGDGKFAKVLQTLVRSFRSVGMKEDFIAFSDRDIEGAKTVRIQDFSKSCHLFKFEFLKQLLFEDYKRFVFLDADTFFVRKPPPLESLLADSPLHAFLECDCTSSSLRKSWWGCPLEEYVQFMKDCGVTSRSIYNVNGGFFMVEKQAIDVVCGLVEDFWRYSLNNGYVFTEEAPLAYAVQMLCKDPEKHLLNKHFDAWATDWRGQFKNHFPDGRPWVYREWMSEQEHLINPAIIHLAKSKEIMGGYTIPKK